MNISSFTSTSEDPYCVSQGFRKRSRSFRDDRSFFNDLPPELKLYVFENLGIKDLAVASLVCKNWQQLRNDERFCAFLFKREFPHCHLPEGEDVRDVYRSRYTLYSKPEQKIFPSQKLFDPRIGAKSVPQVLNGRTLYIGELTGEIGVVEVGEESGAFQRASLMVWGSIDQVKRLFGDTKQKGSGSPITCLAYDKEEEKLYSGSNDGTIKVWKTGNGADLQLISLLDKAHTGAITHLTCSEGKLYSASKTSGAIKSWTLTDSGPVLIKEFTGLSHVLEQSCCAFKNKEVFTPIGVRGPIATLELGVSGIQQKIGEVAVGITALTFADEHLISGSSDGVMALWDIKTGKLLRTLGPPIDYQGEIHSLDYNSNTGELTVRYTGQIELWDFNHVNVVEQRKKDIGSWIPTFATRERGRCPTPK